MLFRKIIIIICTLFFQQIDFAQSYFRFQNEYIVYNADIDKISYNPTKKTNDSSIEANFAISFPITLNTSDNIAVSLRPGIVFGDLYSGIDIGILWSYFTDKIKYILGGVNVHYSNWTPESSYIQDERVIIPYFVVGAGYKSLKNFLVELVISFPLNDATYGDTFQSGNLYYYKACWMTKLNIGFEFEL
jgi:hypothetical protein